MVKTEKKDAVSLPRAEKPEDVGVSSKEIVAFLRDLEENNFEMHSFMVIRHGKVAAECYRAPFKSNYAHQMYSVSKSFTSTAIGIAIEEGILALDTRVIEVFPEYAPQKKDEFLEILTVEDLLTMRAGKAPNLLANKTKTDWVENFFKSSWYAKPGTEFRYISENIYMLCAILVKLTGMSVRDYLHPRLFEPLGIDYPFWETDSKGIEAGGWGIYAKTEDLAKMLLCYSQGGKFNGKQVIPEFWTREATKFQADSTTRHDYNSKFGYGYCFWMNGPCENSYRANGMFSQFSIVFSDYDAIFTCNSAITDEEAIFEYIWKHFPAAFIDSNADETGIDNLKEILESSPIEIPQVSMRSATEKLIQGKTIRLRRQLLLNITGYPMSVLPLALVVYAKDRAGNINDVIFEFSEAECKMSWTEDDESNIINCGMDGKYRYGKIRLGQVDYLVCCNAEWTKENTLEVYIRPIETVAKRTLKFEFKKNGCVTMTPLSTPKVKGIVEFLGGAAEFLIPTKILLSLTRIALKMLPFLVEPKHRGRITK